MTDIDSASQANGTQDIETIAELYLESLEQVADDVRLHELGEKIANAEERKNRLKDVHGEGHALVERVSNIIEDLQEEREELRKTTKTIEECRRDLLEAVVENPVFTFDEQWLEPRVIQAVTHALYGKIDDSFVVQNQEIQQPDDISNIDDLDRIEMEHIIVLLARDRLDSHETVKSHWKRLADSKGILAFEVLAEHGSMESQEAADKIDEDKSTVNNWLKNPINLWDEFIPFYRPEKGTYALSTPGKYFAANFAEISDVNTAKEPEKQDEDELTEDETKSREVGEQTTMGNSAQMGRSTSAGSGSDPKSSATTEGTQEKAEKMFADVVGDEEGST